MILSQVLLSGFKVEDWGLKLDMENICQTAVRFLKCTGEYLAESRSMFTASVNALLLKKAFSQKMWPTGCVLGQLPNIGPALSRLLLNASISSFDSVINTSTTQLERICGRRPPFGQELRCAVQTLPMFNLDIWQVDLNEANQASVKVALTQTNPQFQPSKQRWANRVLILVGNHHNYCKLATKISLDESESVFSWNVMVSPGEVLNCRILHEEMFGMDVVKTFTPTFRNLSNNSSALVKTEPISAIKLPTPVPTPITAPSASQVSKKRPSRGEHCKHEYPGCVLGRCSHPCCKLKFDLDQASNASYDPILASNSTLKKVCNPKIDGSDIDFLRYQFKESSIPSISRIKASPLNQLKESKCQPYQTPQHNDPARVTSTLT